MYLKKHRLAAAIAAGCALTLGAASAAYAATLDTSIASLSTSSATPTSVSAGSSTTFMINVTASGNLPSNSTGVVTVANKYNMAMDGKITASSLAADQTTLNFTTNYNYSQCSTSTPANAQGCASNPFQVSATIVVAAGTPDGTTGTLTVSDTPPPTGMNADPSPAQGYVQVAVTNHAPVDPGAPYVDAASTSPNNNGNFTVDWADSTDPDVGDTVTYTLQKRDANDLGWTTVSSSLSTNSYTFTGESEGSWKYQVQAQDNHGATSNWATDTAAIVVVDKTDPYAPVVTAPTSADYTDSSNNNWYKDSVTVSFAADTSTSSNGDPDLADGSAGSGVDTVDGGTTVTSTDANATTGAFSVTGTTTDFAGNTSNPGTTFGGYLDWQKPTVTCPSPDPVVYYKDPNATLAWTASDPGPSSGLATGGDGGTVSVDTSQVGTHTVDIPAGVATDNVGHSSDLTTCEFKVDYVWGGFLQPINDTAHWVGETTSVFKGGSTVPVKFQLTDALGNVVQTTTAPVFLGPDKGNALPSTVTVDESTYSSTPTVGATYRWDSTGQQYIYNWNTAKNQGGWYWRIGVQLDDGSNHYVSIGLK